MAVTLMSLFFMAAAASEETTETNTTTTTPDRGYTALGLKCAEECLMQEGKSYNWCHIEEDEAHYCSKGKAGGCWDYCTKTPTKTTYDLDCVTGECTIDSTKTKYGWCYYSGSKWGYCTPSPNDVTALREKRAANAKAKAARQEQEALRKSKKTKNSPYGGYEHNW